MTDGRDEGPVGKLVSGKYRIVRLLAEGGMGVVYEAQHAVVRRRFAIKFLRADLAERRDILTRFQREAEAAGALENENVAAAIDFGISEQGAPYIVMEYLVGESLADLLAREGRLPVARAAELVVQACRGVGAAHAAGIVHRDLKPHNLFVCRRQDGTDFIKVLDFGVAKLQAADEASAATRTGTVIGTAAYMAPEQARGEKVVDNRTDVYALGAILYELLSLRRPHPGGSQNAILHHIATQPPIPLEAIEPELPGDLTDVVGYAISSDPAARPASVEALAAAIAPFARREIWPAPPDDPTPRPGELSSTMLARNEAGYVTPAASSGARTPVAAASAAASTADDRAPAAAISVSAVALERPRAGFILGGAFILVAVVVAAATSHRSSSAARPAQISVPGATGLATRPSAAAAPQLAAAGAPVPARQTRHAQAEPIGRPSGHRDSSGRSARHTARLRAEPAGSSPGPTSAPPRPEEHHPQAPSFDPENPYR
jgi:eukaryotic-like serine/threonine-protein kinase